MRPASNRFSIMLPVAVLLAGLTTVVYLSSVTGKEIADEHTLVELGKRIYMEGVLPSGELLSGTVQGDVPTQIKCVSCHRRSGLGSSESSTIIPPVTGAALFRGREARRQDQYRKLYGKRALETGLRPAYTLESLIRAIREGITSNGHALNSLMPRYALDDDATNALIAYLISLGATPSAGVSETHMYIATVVTEGVDQVQSKAMLDVLNRFTNDRNSESRNEIGRAQRGPWYKDYYFKSYREWVLSVWKLKGPQETWRDQLEAYYREQPVFAIVSGLAHGSWQPIHDFCESTSLPCLFPNTQLPVVAKPGDYTIYFSRGAALEGEALGKYLMEINSEPDQRIMQVFMSDEESAVSARALRERLQQSGVSVSDREIRPGDARNGDYWRKLVHKEKPSVLVLWLTDFNDKALASALEQIDTPTQVYLSSSMYSGTSQSFSPPLLDRIYLINPGAQELSGSLGLQRSKAWMKLRKIDINTPGLQANSHFAVVILNSAVKRILDNYSRDYLIERIEHMTENSLYTGTYKRLSLGPGQRYASRGVHISPARNPSGKEAGSWVIP